MAGVSIVLHGDIPYASEAHKKEFCAKCSRVQTEWEVYQKPNNGAWFKKCKVCKGEVCIKNPKIVESLNKEKVKLTAQKTKVGSPLKTPIVNNNKAIAVRQTVKLKEKNK